MKITFKPNGPNLARLRAIGPNLLADLSMDDPSLLRALGAVHRAQEEGIFSSEGAEGAGGKWAPLEARYAARKAKAVGRRKILVLTGGMKDALTKKGDPDYVEEYRPASASLGLFRFGTRSRVAAAHLYGNPALAPERSAVASKVFGGRAPRLPIRDMITKTEAHLAEMRETLKVWFIGRLKQELQARARLGLAR